jgi:hypothetical protein
MPAGRDPGRHLALCAVRCVVRCARCAVRCARRRAACCVRRSENALRNPSRLPYTHHDIEIE